MNNTAKLMMALPWGERTALLPKAMVYAFSLDVRAVSRGPYLTIESSNPKGAEDSDAKKIESAERKGLNGSARVEAKESSKNAVRHLFDESIVTMPEGLRCDVPTGTVEGGKGEIGDANDPSSCWLSLRIWSRLQGIDAKLYFASTGVVDFDGGLSAFRNTGAQRLSGRAFLTSSHEATTSTYRWLERRQLFGVGRIAGSRRPELASDQWELRFSFDLYAAL